MSLSLSYKFLVKLLAFSLFFCFFYSFLPAGNRGRKVSIEFATSFQDKNGSLWSPATSSNKSRSPSAVHLWCTVVKMGDSKSRMTRKFEIFVKSLALHSDGPLSLNVLTDRKSRPLVSRIISTANADKNGSAFAFHRVSFYDIDVASEKIKPMVAAMRRYFSSVPGTYYSDSLFYVSLGLHEIAPQHHDRVVLLDIDLKFEKSIFSLFDEFSKFGPDTLFGLAPELTPVYRHILWKWKQTNPLSHFGEPSYRGYSGLNSGVVLLRLNAIRKSHEYRSCLSPAYIHSITSKYFFKGHLGDQDFYTLLAMEKPHLISILPCTWNRQLCQWWKDHGYAEVFDDFARCTGQINIYHGNCNTPVPIS